MSAYQDTTVTWPELLFIQNHVLVFASYLFIGASVSYTAFHRLIDDDHIHKWVYPKDWFWMLAWLINGVLLGFAGFYNRTANGPLTELTNSVLVWFLLFLGFLVLNVIWAITFFRGIHSWRGTAVWLKTGVFALALTLLILAFAKTANEAGYFMIGPVLWHGYLLVVTFFTWWKLRGAHVQIKQRAVRDVQVTHHRHSHYTKDSN